MNTNLIKLFLVTIALVVSSAVLTGPGWAGQSPFPDTSIISDFGPKAGSGPNDLSFHDSVVYEQPSGTAVKAAETGLLDKIEYDSEAGWVIGIKGKSGEWTYSHTFNNDALPGSGIFHIGKCSKGLFLYRDATKEAPAKEFYLKRRIEEGEEFAAVGTSGKCSACLEMKLNDGKNNPVSQFDDYVNAFDVALLVPSPYEDIEPKDLSKNYDLRFSVTGKNLDSAIIFVDDDKQGDKELCFSYGGRPGEERININPAINKDRGVEPNGDFKNIFKFPCDFSSLKSRSHQITIKTIDAEGKASVHKFAFTVKKDNTVGELKGEYLGLGPFDDGVHMPKDKVAYKVTFTAPEFSNLKFDKDGRVSLSMPSDGVNPIYVMKGKASIKVEMPEFKTENDAFTAKRSLVSKEGVYDYQMVITRKNDGTDNMKLNINFDSVGIKENEIKMVCTLIEGKNIIASNETFNTPLRFNDANFDVNFGQNRLDFALAQPLKP